MCLGGEGGVGGARLHAAESEAGDKGGKVQQLQAGEGVHDRGHHRQGGQPYQRGGAGRPVRLHQPVWYGPAPAATAAELGTREAALALARAQEL